MAKIEPYKAGSAKGGETVFAILIIGALAYFGYTFYMKNKNTVEKIDVLYS